MHAVLERVCERRIIPVVVIEDPDRAAMLGAALREGGLPVAEITLRTSGALEAIRTLARDPDMIVGVGSVIRAEQVDLARDAGAAFVVTPGLSTGVLDRCDELGIPVIPGVATATEIITALDRGIELLKFFPAEANGGIGALRALAGPFAQVRFIPTGGVTASNARAFLDLPAVAAVGGSWMVAAPLITDGQFGTLSRLTSEAVRLAVGAVS